MPCSLPLVLMSENLSHAAIAVRLPVLHGAVIPQRRFEYLVHRRVLPDRYFTQLNIKARPLPPGQRDSHSPAAADV